MMANHRKLLELWHTKIAPKWRNWQTHGTQNPAPFTGHVGSTPTFGTNLKSNTCPKFPILTCNSVQS